jgi:hypothetical protein
MLAESLGRGGEDTLVVAERVLPPGPAASENSAVRVTGVMYVRCDSSL